MSQFTKAISFIDTGGRKILSKGFSPLFVDVFDGTTTLVKSHDSIGRVYKIQAKLETSFVVMETSSQDEDVLEAVARAKRQIIEAVFGEFRPYFRRIEGAIYNHDVETAGRILRELEYTMFEER